MHEMLFSKFDPALGFREENAHFPDPASPETYDPAIAASEGLDLQLLGIGFNGHIAFNEPMREDEISVGAFAALPTRVLPLSQETIEQNTKVTAGGDAALVPRYAATMGMAPILAAKKCLLLACFAEQTAPLNAIIARNGEPCAGSPAAEVACGENALRLYAKPLAYEVMRGGKTIVQKTGIGICIDGKWLGDGALPREVVRGESAEEKVVASVYKKGLVDLRRVEKLADFGDFAIRIVAREDGVAYRFEPAKGGIVTDERADVTLPKTARCWFCRTSRTTIGCEEAVPEFADATALATDPCKAFYLPFAYSAEGKSVAVLETALHDYPVWNFGDVAATDAGIRLSSLFAYRKGASRTASSVARVCSCRRAGEALRSRHRVRARVSRLIDRLLVGAAGEGRVGLVERFRQQGRCAGMHDRDVRALH